MTRIAVDLGRLESFIARLERFQSSLAQACADADAGVRELRGSWTGSAAVRQAAAHEQWRAGAAEVRDALTELRTAAALAAENYGAAVAANRRMWAV
jgi:WXG100 family type VII secretion target